MFLAEPPPTQADLHFRLFGFPVRVHPFFWIVALLLGMGGFGDEADPVETLLWVVVMFVSILVHELGHAFLQRRFGGRPWITLYGMGGLASCDDCDRSPRSQILISLAGPVAGFLFAAVVVAILAATGHFIGLRWHLMPVAWTPYEPFAQVLIFYLLWINIFWGVLNLLPIYPLDGGQIAREFFTLNHPRSGIVQSLWLSVFAAGGVAAFGLIRFGSFLMALFFGYLAYSSYQTLRSYQHHGY